MEIRAVEARDLGQLVERNGNVQRLHAAAQPLLFKASPANDEIAAWFTGLLARQDARVLVGTVAGAVVGYAAGLIRAYPENPFRHGLTIGVIDQLAIDPEYQRRGYGEALLDRLIAQLDAGGAERIELSVWAFNAGARFLSASRLCLRAPLSVLGTMIDRGLCEYRREYDG
jgi:ribosomal protein S18 acetylase RimI-like enzyme